MTNRRGDDFINKDWIGIMLAHRRCMTKLHKKYNLRGYAIELLLLIALKCGYREGYEVAGYVIRRCTSKRFHNSLTYLCDVLIDNGYIHDRKGSAQQSRHYYSITSEGLKVYDDCVGFFRGILQEDRDFLIMVLSGEKVDGVTNKADRYTGPPRGKGRPKKIKQ
jgi:DNA-binding PadR family transcriptional regulator